MAPPEEFCATCSMQEGRCMLLLYISLNIALLSMDRLKIQRAKEVSTSGFNAIANFSNFVLHHCFTIWFWNMHDASSKNKRCESLKSTFCSVSLWNCFLLKNYLNSGSTEHVTFSCLSYSLSTKVCAIIILDAQPLIFVIRSIIFNQEKFGVQKCKWHAERKHTIVINTG